MLITDSKEKILWLLTTLLFVLSAVLKTSYTGVILAVVLCLIFLSFIIKKNFRFQIRFTCLCFYILLFACFVAVSSRWAIVPQYAMRRAKTLVQVMLVLIVLSTCYQDEGGVDKILKALMWNGYIIMAYVVARYGVSSVIRMLRNGIRLNDFLNANSLGIAAAYSIIINAYYIIQRKRVNILDLLTIPAFIILVASGSRKALVLVAGGIFATFILQNWNNKQVIKSTLKVIGIVFVLLIVGYFILKLPFMSGIMKRIEDMYLLMSGQGGRGLSGSLRLEYIKLGVNLFKEHPFLGIGIDNTRVYTLPLYGHDHYLHNNYVELLAGGGIVGAILYYWIYLFLLKSFVKYRKYRDAEFEICLILMLCALVMEYGMVTYESKETYYMLLLFCLEIDKLRKFDRCKYVCFASRSLKLRL